MDTESGILLKNHWDNKIKLRGELGWFVKEYNASAGYTWRFVLDSSAVYEPIEEITLHPSTEAEGVPSIMIWKFKGIRLGKGSILFQLYPPNSVTPIESTTINITVEL